MDKRQYAVHLASLGFRVFRLRDPARGNPKFTSSDCGKTPLVRGWQDEATSDLSAVYALWTARDGSPANYNIGMAMGKGFLGVDIDMKNGHDGLEAWKAAGLPECPSWTVKTPSGGYHYVFKTEATLPNKVGVLDGVDLRSEGGYLVAPGSVLADGRSYQLISSGEKLDELPIDALTVLLAKSRPVDAPKITETVPLDDPRDIGRAAEWLVLEAPEAIKGQAGDYTAYVVACRMRDMGLSEAVAQHLMASLYRHKCAPYDPDWLAAKVRNAYLYAQNTPGALSVQHDLPNASTFYWRKPLTKEERETRPKRPWIAEGLLMRGKITVLAAPGGTGKSAFLTALATCLATGDGFRLGFNIREPVRTMIISPEDDPDEWDRRAEAIETAWGIEMPEDAHLMACGSETMKKFRLATKEGRAVSENSLLLEHIIRTCKENKIGAILFDPLIYFHGVEENSNGEMMQVMALLADIAHKTNCAVLLSHHVSKAPADLRAASDVIRGASAIIGAARLAFLMRTMTAEEAQELGVHANSRLQFKALVEVKTNLTAAMAEPRWFEMKKFILANGEADRYLESVTFTSAPTAKIVTWLLENAPEDGQWPLSEAAEAARAAIYVDATVADVKARIKEAIRSPVETANGRIVLRGGIIHLQRFSALH